MLRMFAASIGAMLLPALILPAQTVTFTPNTYNNNLWHGGITADINADGLEDFVSSDCSGSLAVTLSKGDGTYAPPVCYALPSGNATLYAAGDLYSRGYFDLLVANESGTVYVFFNTGAGVLQLRNSFNLAGTPTGMIAADFNADGNVDLAYDMAPASGTSTSTLNVLFGNGDGTFRTGPITPFTITGNGPGALSIGDMDNDSKADVVVHGTNGALVLYGDNTGNFTLGPAVGVPLSSYTLADLNSDGTMDMVGETIYSTYLDVEWGHHNRTFTTQRIQLRNCTGYIASPTVGDFNGDGIPDIAVIEAPNCTQPSPFTLDVLPGKGDGTFGPDEVVYSSGNRPLLLVQTVRANRDTKPDLVALEGTPQPGNTFDAPIQQIFLNTTSGNFRRCNPPNFPATGINFCSPTSTTGATSPVWFSLGTSNQKPARDIEVWVDGKKYVDDKKQAFSYYNFTDWSLTLPDGQHKVDVYSKTWDGTRLFATTPLTVGSDVCPQLPSGYLGINVCSPIQSSTLSSTVLAYARGKTDAPIVRMELWVDGVKRYSTFGSDELKTTVTLVPSSHTFTYFLVNLNGVVYSYTVQATVQ